MKVVCFVVILISCAFAQNDDDVIVEGVCVNCLEDVMSKMDHFLENFPHDLEQVCY